MATCDLQWDNVGALFLLNGANGSTTFIDEKGGTAIANGGVTLSNLQSKFGGSSYRSGLSSGGVTFTPTSAINFSGDFTVEMWIYRTANVTGNLFGTTLPIRAGQSYSAQLKASVTSTGRVDAQVRGVSSSSTNSVVSPTIQAIPLNTWTHVAVQITGISLQIYINGVAAGSTTVTVNRTGVEVRPGEYFGLGNFVSTAGASTPSVLDAFQGYIDCFRITHNNTARYSGPFTPATEQFPAISCFTSVTPNPAQLNFLAGHTADASVVATYNRELLSPVFVESSSPTLPVNSGGFSGSFTTSTTNISVSTFLNSANSTNYGLFVGTVDTGVWELEYTVTTTVNITAADASPSQFPWTYTLRFWKLIPVTIYTGFAKWRQRVLAGIIHYPTPDLSSEYESSSSLLPPPLDFSSPNWNKTVRWSSPNILTITVPAGCPKGVTLGVHYYGSGGVVFSPAAGVVITDQRTPSTVSCTLVSLGQNNFKLVSMK